MASTESILKFNNVNFEYEFGKPILDEVNFSVRKGSKNTLMGQNGAGKSSIFKLIMNELSPMGGTINRGNGISIALSRQVIQQEDLELTVRDFFQKQFSEKIYAIDPKIDTILEVVHLKADKEKKLKEFSGGQQARLLLAAALIVNPDLLLLDEPTNNLDKAGIEHLKDFIKNYENTVIVISHDAPFLNSFTEGVIYLDGRTKKVEQYVGDYFSVVKEIAIRVEKEKRKNAQLLKKIQENKDKSNFFANKGGRLRAVAKKMREEAEDAEENMVDVKQEDRTIRNFTIPFQKDVIGELVTINSFTRLINDKVSKKEAKIALRKRDKLLLAGPNGIGKSTFLKALVEGNDPGMKIAKDVVVGYYRQDFSNLDFNETVNATLRKAMHIHNEEKMRGIASGFLIKNDIMNTKIGQLSEGQKGLVAFARLVLMEPAVLIMDEPTNHINFRHIPVIAKAIEQFEGAVILVSHVPHFVEEVKVTEILDLAK